MSALANKNLQGPALYAERAGAMPAPTDPPLWSSARLQLKVLGALLLRESLTRYGRHNIGFLWLFVEPMIFTLGVTAIWSLLKMGKGGDIPIAGFALTGYSTILLWRNMPSRCVGALAPNYPLLFHRQVKPIDIYLSRCILEACGATISFVVLGVALTYVGLISTPRDFLTVIFGWSLLVWYAFSVSLFIGALSERSEIVEKFWHPATYLLIPLSGAMFMLSMFPPGVREYLLWVPTVSCIELIREGYFSLKYDWYYDIVYVVWFNSIALLVALLLIRHLNKTLSPH